MVEKAAKQLEWMREESECGRRGPGVQQTPLLEKLQAAEQEGALLVKRAVLPKDTKRLSEEEIRSGAAGGNEIPKEA